LPEEFQRHGLVVQAMYRRSATGRRLPGWGASVIKVVEIERAIYSSRFTVRKTDDCGYMLFEDGMSWTNLAMPFNLPEEFQQDGLRVDITFHKTWNLTGEKCGAPPYLVEIISIMNSPEERAQTRITGGIGAGVVPWQVLLSVNDMPPAGADLQSVPLQNRIFQL
jgi:hypothetical protein